METAETTDRIYEESRRKAEQEFWLAHTEWLKRLEEEGTVLIEPEGSGPDESFYIPVKYIKPDNGQLQYPSGLGLDLFKSCVAYVKAELWAYAGLLRRRGLPPWQIVSELEKRAEITLNETHRRKWNPSEKKILEFFRNRPVQFTWACVEDSVREYVRQELEPAVWFDQIEQGDSSAPAKGPEPQPAIRDNDGDQIGPDPRTLAESGMAQAGPKLSNRKAPFDLTPIPSLDELKKRNSLHEAQAAVVFDVTTRRIRGWDNEGKLNRSVRGRIVTTDQAFEELYRATHGPAHQ